jgi:hypothetical protein
MSTPDGELSTAREPRPQRTVRRFLTGAVSTVVAVVGGVLSYFVCMGTFAGYPRYHTDTLSDIVIVLLALTGGVAWIVDERRADADG